MVTPAAPPDVRVERGESSVAGLRHPVWGRLRAYNPDDVGLEKYDIMRRDETVRAGLQFIKLCVISRLGQYVNPDEPEVEEFVNFALRLMRGTVESAVGEVLSALWAGFSVTEKVWDEVPRGKFRGKLYVSKLRTLHPLTVHPGGIKADDHGNIVEVVQHESAGSSAIRLPASKVIHYAYDGSMGVFGNVWGQSVLRCCYRSWFRKDITMKLQSMFQERFAVPLAVGYAPKGSTICPVHGVEEDWATVMMCLMRNIAGRSEISLPVETDDEGRPLGVPRIEFLEATRRAEAVYTSSLAYDDTAMLRGMLIPSLTLQEPEHASRAQATVHLDALMQVLQEVLREMAEDVLMEQLVRSLIEYNFAYTDRIGHWQTRPLTEEDLERTANIFFKLTGAGMGLDPGEPRDQAFVRRKFAMPELTAKPEEGSVVA